MDVLAVGEISREVNYNLEYFLDSSDDISNITFMDVLNSSSNSLLEASSILHTSFQFLKIIISDKPIDKPSHKLSDLGHIDLVS